MAGYGEGYGDFSASAGGVTNGQAPQTQEAYPSDYSGGATSYGAAAPGGGYGGGAAGYAGPPQTNSGAPIKSNPEDGKMINSPESSNSQKMFIGGISKSTTTNSLRAHFEQFGAVKDVEIKVDPNTGMSRGFGFVLFELPESVTAVVDAGQQYLDGKRIDPKPAEKRNCKIFVGGISPNTTNEAIEAAFSIYGQIDVLERRTDRNRGTLQPFAFVTFKDDSVASQLAKTRWVEVEGKRTEVKLSIENKQKLFNQGYGGDRGGYGGPQGGGYGGGRGGGPAGGGYGGGYGQWGAGGGAAQGGGGGAAWGGGYGGGWGAGAGPQGGYGDGGGGYGGPPTGAVRGRGGGPGPVRGGGYRGGRGGGRPSPY